MNDDQRDYRERALENVLKDFCGLVEDISHCVEGEGITWLGIVDVGVIVVAQESFLGISVSGVGIS